MLDDKTLTQLDEAEKKATLGKVVCHGLDIVREENGKPIAFTKYPEDAHCFALARNHLRELIDEIKARRQPSLASVLGFEAGLEESKAETQRLRSALEIAKKALRYYVEIYPEPRGKEVYTRKAREAIAKIDLLGGKGD